MANWCRYCEGSYPKYWCKVTNNYIPWGIVERSCMNDGYDCSNYHISTLVGIMLNKPVNDKVLTDIRGLRDNYASKNEEYENLLKMYDAIGPILADKIDYDNNSVEISKKIYSVLKRVSIFVEKGKEDRAIDYYCKMVGCLVNKYNLNELYNTEADFINRMNKDAKKVQKLTKVLDK